MGTRLAALVVALAVLSGCGSVDEQEAGETGAVEATEELLPAPPIEAIDEPAPESALELLVLPSKQGWTQYGTVCVPEGVGELDGAPVERGGPCPDEMVAAILDEERKALPADEAEARAVARLRLDDGGAFYVVEYRSRGLGTCAVVYGEDDQGMPLGGSGGGACVDDPIQRACPEVCVVPVGGFGDRLVFAGTVPSEGESVRLAFEDGYVARYPLSGPALPSDPSRRVFMVDQGHGMFTKIELLVGERVVAEASGPGLEDIFEGMPDQTPGTKMELNGRTLHVEIGPEAPPEAQELLEAENVGFACLGADDPRPVLMEDAAASVVTRFEPGARTIDVELGAEPEGKLLFCSAGLPGPVEGGLYRNYVSFEELQELLGPPDG